MHWRQPATLAYSLHVLIWAWQRILEQLQNSLENFLLLLLQRMGNHLVTNIKIVKVQYMTQKSSREKVDILFGQKG
jgi:hypothetical protein